MYSGDVRVVEPEYAEIDVAGWAVALRAVIDPEAVAGTAFEE